MLSILIYILVLILVFGLLGWVINQLPLQGPFKQAAIVVLAIIFILLLLGAVGVIPIGYPRWG
jgi:hypothetical protein